MVPLSIFCCFTFMQFLSIVLNIMQIISFHQYIHNFANFIHQNIQIIINSKNFATMCSLCSSLAINLLLSIIPAFTNKTKLYTTLYTNYISSLTQTNKYIGVYLHIFISYFPKYIKMIILNTDIFVINMNKMFISCYDIITL